jgi:putative NIF3 family GTP cyclohydrolase 1 type 2
MGHTSRIESALRAILPPDHYAEYDYKGLLQGSPKDEIELLIAQVNAGILEANEARAILNRPPLAAAPPEVPVNA